MYRPGAVYAIRCVPTGDVYIGSSRHVHRRLAEHRSLLRRGWHYYHRLNELWAEHGEDSFVFQVLQLVGEYEDLGAAELAWMARVVEELPGCLVNGGGPRPHVRRVGYRAEEA
jgi:group I intron endonuclease